MCNWDGEKVNKTDKWYDKKLFSIGDFDVTTGDVAIGSGTLALIIVVSVLIFMYISWRNRKKIAATAVRVSIAVRKSTKKIR